MRPDGAELGLFGEIRAYAHEVSRLVPLRAWYRRALLVAAVAIVATALGFLVADRGSTPRGGVAIVSVSPVPPMGPKTLEAGRENYVVALEGLAFRVAIRSRSSRVVRASLRVVPASRPRPALRQVRTLAVAAERPATISFGSLDDRKLLWATRETVEVDVADSAGRILTRRRYPVTFILA